MSRLAQRLERIDACCWRIPRDARSFMRVEGRIFASEAFLKAAVDEEALEQVANVAALPGIRTASMAMPDIHWGYGFCIGGVCATDPAQGGVISPGGVGYDINCGVRLLRTDLAYRSDVAPRMEGLVDALFRRVPAGVGREGPYPFPPGDLKRLLARGPQALDRIGEVTPRDLEFTEAGGCLTGADPGAVSPRAFERGARQCGTLGGGNHFVEVQVVEEIFDAGAAAAFGLEKGRVTVMIHSGSRGLGHQVCDDTLRAFRGLDRKYGYTLPDRQLACAPAESPEGRRYIGAMRAAANFAWCNRQLLMQEVRRAFGELFGRPWEALGMELIYDVAHNIAKREEHTVEGERTSLWVHRKGATRAFPPGHPEVPECYRAEGQPVLIPGDMGRASYVLAGLSGAMERSFGTACHGAGRAMSRTAALGAAAGRMIRKELLARGVVARSRTRKGLAEEIPEAYKDVAKVVEVVERAGLSRRVARLRPVGVVKG